MFGFVAHPNVMMMIRIIPIKDIDGGIRYPNNVWLTINGRISDTQKASDTPSNTSRQYH
jgi:hypothetical protein